MAQPDVPLAGTDADTDDTVERVDVLVVGAGISGLGAAVHLQRECPGKRWLVLEAQGGLGGTWRTHRYPGIRSDSDLFTFGYGFKPWHGKPIATAGEILSYLGEVVDEHGLAPGIRYHHRIVAAEWHSGEARWQVTAEVGDPEAGAPPRLRRFSAGFLWMCQGYYRHGQGHTPHWPGLERFQGQLIHPQHWPEDTDLAGRRVVVVGSGATAATLIPAIAGQCAQVTMLQRSPTYFITGRNANELADMLRQLDVPPEWTHEIVRRKVLFDQANFTRRCFSEPEVVRQELLAGVTAALGGGPEAQALVAAHFTPRYLPWRQRIAFVPDADLFRALRSGQAAVATGDIECFTESGIQLSSGEHLPADVVVTATGFDLNVLGDIAVRVDGQPLDFAQCTTWRGTMFTGLPNMAWVFGYFRASWTLRADLIAGFVCRLLKHLDAKGARSVVPRLRPDEADMPRKPWVDPANFNPGYLNRGLHLLPRQGDRDPWVHAQDHAAERLSLPAADLDDGSLVYR